MFPSARVAVCAAAAAMLLAGWAAAADRPREDPQQLVRRMVSNELKDLDSAAYHMYRTRRETPKGSRTSERVETKEGSIGRIVAIDDKPLSTDQLQKQDRTLAKLAADPDWRQRQLRTRQEEIERTRHVLQAMPDGFLYQYDGTEPDGSVRLTFSPNPNFNPPNREAQVFYGMAGKLWIDPANARLTRIEANLIRDVDFGWGIFGHLDRGGSVALQQTRLADGSWQTTGMVVKLTGKVFLFKNLNVDQKVSFSDFRRTPGDLTLKQAVDLLREEEPLISQTAK